MTCIGQTSPFIVKNGMNMDRLKLNEELIKENFIKAHESQRKRFPLLMHEKGAYLNEVYNFICSDSYMQPHLHPGDEKVEIIQVISGEVAVIYFGDEGEVSKITILNPDKNHTIEVPAFTWHTYIMISEEVITYETMHGIYHPETWKTFATWAPPENTIESKKFFDKLKRTVDQNIKKFATK
jgi:cupin fold WbuC family metalloprotein